MAEEVKSSFVWLTWSLYPPYNICGIPQMLEHYYRVHSICIMLNFLTSNKAGKWETLIWLILEPHPLVFPEMYFLCGSNERKYLSDYEFQNANWLTCRFFTEYLKINCSCLLIPGEDAFFDSENFGNGAVTIIEKEVNWNDLMKLY